MGITTQEGNFGAFMAVHLINDGPVTMMLDSRV
jgi:D-Tyr-tRNAtyr deacylase